MARVTILRDLRFLLAGVSALNAAGAATGCAATTTDEGAASDEQGVEKNVAGSGAVSLHDHGLYYGSTSGGDEFLRVGEKMTVAFQIYDVYDAIAQVDPTVYTRKPSESTIDVTLHVSYRGYDEREVSGADVACKWGPGSGGIPTGRSAEFSLAKAPRVMFSFRVKEGSNQVEMRGSTMWGTSFPVFGAFEPAKLALFDNDQNGASRVRIVEGGKLSRQANVTLSYTDWRADHLVERWSLDTWVGKRQTFGRFGASVIDVYGEVEYEIDVAYTADGGASWNGLTLNRKQLPDVLKNQSDTRRSSFENQLFIGTTQSDLRLAFHVRAFLKVPTGLTEYKQGLSGGDRILVADKWDNAGGSDYTLAVDR